MGKIFFSVLSFWFLSMTLITSVYAQTEFPDDFSKEIDFDRTFCKPGVKNKSKSKGVLFEYQKYSGRKYRSNGNPDYIRLNDQSRFLGKIKIPILNKCNLKWLLGFQYQTEDFSFERIVEIDKVFQSLNTKKFKSFRISNYLLKPLNDQFYLNTVISLDYNGDYDQFINYDGRYRSYRAIATFGWKKSEFRDMGAGLYYKNGFRRKSFYPFLYYYQTFSEKWGFESILPVQLFMRRNLNEKSILLFGTMYNSMEYSFDATLDGVETIYEIKNQSIDAIVKYQHRIAKWFWLNVESGYQFQLNPVLELENSESQYSINGVGNSVVFKIGISIVPPNL